MTSLTLFSTTKYANFPPDYRAEEVASILNWIKWGESGVVVGGSGTGKSNIAGYLATRPDVVSGYMPEPIDNYLFVHFDLNELAHVNTPNFYRFMLYELQRRLRSHPELGPQLELIVDQIRNPEDTFALYMAVREAHDLIIQGADKHVIWLLDRFEKGCPQLEADTLNSLRSLRDQHIDSLSYVAFSRHPLARLRNPAEFDELHEILIMHTCYVGPMNQRDGQWPVRQIENRFKTTLHPAVTKQLFDLCGGLPAFLKVSYSALAAGDLSEKESFDQWRSKINSIPAFQRNCQEIWDSYELHEQSAMRNLALCPNGYVMPLQISEYLTQMGILKKSYNGETVELFSPLFADFIRGQTEDEHGIIFRGKEVFRNGQLINLTRYEFALLECLFARDGEVCTREELIQSVWKEEISPNADDERLPALIKRLRFKVNDKNEHEYVENVRGRGYKFVQYTDI